MSFIWSIELSQMHYDQYYLFLFSRSSVGPEYARNRAIVYLILGLIFLGGGIGVTVSLFIDLLNTALLIHNKTCTS